MKTFENYEEIKDVYDKGEFDIFYENKDKNIKYAVSHIGSTIYCRNIEKGMGMGAINNFPITDFYAIPKPKIETIVEDTSTNSDEKVKV